MAMDFFERQDAARRHTGRLVILFILAVLVIIISTYLVVAGAIVYSQSRGGGEGARFPGGSGHEVGSGAGPGLWDPQLLLWVGLGTIALVAGGSLFKLAQLRAGGSRIAEDLGGEPIQPNTSDPAERKVLNVVEEMAIASGTPAPPVYLMRGERGINAFAAGFEPGDAVIGVTRGAIDRLSRAELQGVIAHEFSHIFNGDMRLNIRLIGVLHGILIIGIVGYFVLRGGFYGAAASSGRSNRKGGGAGMILAIGLGLIVVGFLGTLFGNMIKAAVSRQREYLADASAVQFTRNPGGLAGALKKIGGLKKGSKLDSPNAPEASHMLFGQGVSAGLSSLFATHPPLKKRIRRVEPSWEGDFARSEAPVEPGRPAPGGGLAAAGLSSMSGAAPAPVAAAAGGSASGEAASAGPGARPAGLIAGIGQPTDAHLRYAADLRESIPGPLTDAAREPYTARALIHALLIDEAAEPRQIQLDYLSQQAERGLRHEVGKLLPALEKLRPEARLPLLDLAIPTLRELTREQYEAFDQTVRALIRADRRIDLFEWMLQRILSHHLAPVFHKTRPPRVRYYSLKGLRGPCQTLLSTLARVGSRGAGEAFRAFEQGVSRLGLDGLDFQPGEQCGLDALDDALRRLNEVHPRYKRGILTAAAAVIAADREVTLREAELLRAVADTLDCPMPPLLPGQPLM